MNQILNTSKKRNNFKKIFKIQFVVSLLLIFILLIYVFKQIKQKQEKQNISQIIGINAKLNTVFSSNIEKTYLGRLKIEKINLDYYVYNSYTEELLKLLPCKYSGGNLRQTGNICIIGHNYFDGTFFSNLYKLSIGDSIIIEDLEKSKYKYTVYDIYEINESNIYEALKSDTYYKTLTLVTCTFDKTSRLIIKAKIN